MTAALLLVAALTAAEPLTPGQHLRTLTVDDRARSYLVHLPPQYDPGQPAPVVLVLHGTATNGTITMALTGMNGKADEAGFIVVYPNGTGRGTLLVWNAGGRQDRFAENLPDDVRFIDRLLDDLAAVANVDPRRVYATGFSNGGMMSYRLAAELSHRIAAIAPVAGTMAIEEARPQRPVPVLHFHGTDDRVVPTGGAAERVAKYTNFRSVAETLRIWCTINGCEGEPVVEKVSAGRNDGATVQVSRWGPGQAGAEVVYVEIGGGGHTWPGRPSPLAALGRSTAKISANDMIWEFFRKHRLPE